MRQLYRSGMVVETSPEVLRVRIDRACDTCSSGCARTLPDLCVDAHPGAQPGTRVQLGLSARSLNVHCLALFGPWLVVVAGLVVLDLRGASLGTSVAAVMIGGLLALWSGRRLALAGWQSLSVRVAAVDSGKRLPGGYAVTERWRGSSELVHEGTRQD
ncbi:MAG: SoxR reducing system RseC family protein [Pseudomonadales bacterium]